MEQVFLIFKPINSLFAIFYKIKRRCPHFRCKGSGSAFKEYTNTTYEAADGRDLLAALRKTERVQDPHRGHRRLAVLRRLPAPFQARGRQTAHSEDRLSFHTRIKRLGRTRPSAFPSLNWFTTRSSGFTSTDTVFNPLKLIKDTSK